MFQYTKINILYHNFRSICNVFESITKKNLFCQCIEIVLSFFSVVILGSLQIPISRLYMKVASHNKIVAKHSAYYLDFFSHILKGHKLHSLSQLSQISTLWDVLQEIDHTYFHRDIQAKYNLDYLQTIKAIAQYFREYHHLVADLFFAKLTQSKSSCFLSSSSSIAEFQTSVSNRGQSQISVPEIEKTNFDLARLLLFFCVIAESKARFIQVITRMDPDHQEFLMEEINTVRQYFSHAKHASEAISHLSRLEDWIKQEESTSEESQRQIKKLKDQIKGLKDENKILKERLNSTVKATEQLLDACQAEDIPEAIENWRKLKLEREEKERVALGLQDALKMLEQEYNDALEAIQSLKTQLLQYQSSLPVNKQFVSSRTIIRQSFTKSSVLSRTPLMLLADKDANASNRIDNKENPQRTTKPEYLQEISIIVKNNLQELTDRIQQKEFSRQLLKHLRKFRSRVLQIGRQYDSNSSGTEFVSKIQKCVF